MSGELAGQGSRNIDNRSGNEDFSFFFTLSSLLFLLHSVEPFSLAFFVVEWCRYG